jgi:signal transduction histidine kinase/ligand-binding sensor domain-containing protein
MNKRYIIAVSLFFQLICGESFAQTREIKFNLVEGNNGEPLGRINAITQDPHGYMWFSGQGNRCIYRYDGIHFIAFKQDSLNKNSLGGTNTETIYADSSGMIWIGFFTGGLDQYNPSSGVFKHFVHDSTDSASLGAGMISAILRDHRGRLWIGTENGLDRLDDQTGKFIHYKNIPGDPTSLSSNIVRAIYEDRKGVLWVGTGFEFSQGQHKHRFNNPEDGGLNRMENNGAFTRFLHEPNNPNSLINNKVRSIFEDSRGVFWVGTCGDGLHTMNREKGTFERHLYDPANPDQLSRPALKGSDFDNPITFIKEDINGSIWIGTYASGVNRYDALTKKITHYESSNGYPDKACWTAYQSRDKVLWLSSTDQGGFLYRTDPINKKIPNFFTTGLPTCVLEDMQGFIWSWSFAVGLQQYDPFLRLVTKYQIDTTDSINFLNNNVSSIFQNQKDSIWFGTINGIIILNKKSNHFSWLRYKTDTDLIPRKLKSNNVTQIIQGKNGLKWFATSGGLFQYNSENQMLKGYIPEASDSNTISTKDIRSVMEDISGDIFAASGNGINRLTPGSGRFSHYLKGVAIKKLYQDSEGIIWAGSDSFELYRYEKKVDAFERFSFARLDITRPPIVNIMEDNQKNLWIITASGIVKLNSDRKSYFFYGRKYDIRSNTLRFGAICKKLNGEILLANNNGFYVFNSTDLNDNIRPLQIIFTRLIVNYQPVNPGIKGPLAKPIEETEKLELTNSENNFTIDFAAIDYWAPEATKYYTLLEHYDSTWRQSGGDRNAYFVRVPPGKYVFRVKAINIDGVWAEKSMQIIMLPPWWMTWWAYVLYGILLLTVILAVHRFQKQRTIRIERQKAQVKELAQAKEIEKAYTELKATQAQLIHAEKMASLGEMTAGIAHEIQNPLNFVNNFSEINKELLGEFISQNANVKTTEGNDIPNDPVLKNIENNLDKIIHHGHRADSIVKSMLQHTKSSTGQKEPVDLNGLADEYLKLAYHGLRAKDKSFNANMVTAFDKNIASINIIPQDIGRVLLNLFNNAFYAVSEKNKLNADEYKPTVSVSTMKLDHKVVISVKDNGMGIPEKVRDKIFQPFFTTKPTGQGTGLGLSLSYDIIKANQGEIKVESKEGEFTEFILQLPG